MFMRGTRVGLRTPRKEIDLEVFLEGFDLETKLFLGNPFPIYEQGEVQWFESLGKNDRNHVFTIVDLEKDNQPVGTMGIHNISWVDRTAVTGACILKKEYREKRYGREAKELLLEWAFRSLNLEIILSEVVAFNERSIRYSLACGYEEVARIPNMNLRKGARHESVILQITKDAWENHQKQNTK